MAKVCPRDHAEAARWFRKAAEQGDAEAQYNLGVSYLNGDGVPQDYTEALQWFRRAAEQGDPRAQFNLGYMYFSGKGVPQDHVMAYLYLDIAAAHGFELARQNQIGVASKMTPEEFVKAQRMAGDCAAKDYKGCEF